MADGAVAARLPIHSQRGGVISLLVECSRHHREFVCLDFIVLYSYLGLPFHLEGAKIQLEVEDHGVFPGLEVFRDCGNHIINALLEEAPEVCRMRR